MLQLGLPVLALLIYYNADGIPSHWYQTMLDRLDHSPAFFLHMHPSMDPFTHVC